MPPKPPESHRRFYCARCGAAVQLCTRCDRGQRYCGSSCAKSARGESLRRAGKRYRQSARGREANAERQRRFRERRASVTHHSADNGPDEPADHPESEQERAQDPPSMAESRTPDPDPTPVAKQGSQASGKIADDPVCDACLRACGRFTRFDFLPPRRRVRGRPPWRYDYSRQDRPPRGRGRGPRGAAPSRG